MSFDGRVPVVLCWHMHQPEYRDLSSGEVQESWVMLRALKDYVDMAAHLEQAPEARVVVNFSPVLLDQLDACAAQLRALAASRPAPGDPLLRALAQLPAFGSRARADVVQACSRPVPPRMAERSPGLAAARQASAGAVERGEAAGLDDATVRALLVRYLLCWVGETLRADARASALAAHVGPFDAEHGLQLLHLIHDAITGLIARYARLCGSGQIELSMSPYFHPLTPLLIDFATAREAVHDAALPSTAYPGGAERARWHLEAGRDRFEQLTGVRPRGCWPSEGALSEAALQMIAQAGFSWTASSERVLAASARAQGIGSGDPHRRYLFARTRLSCFFRDDALSDAVGFDYQHWAAADAVADFLGRLDRISKEPGSCACVILDGENPWDGYAQNGAAFLRTLYRQLGSHPRLRPATFSHCVEATPAVVHPLPPLVAGSWVDGHLLTWIGDVAKNRIWERLVRTKRDFDEAARAPEVHRMLGACEGSDWFWWADSRQTSHAPTGFDRLLELHLRNVERAIRPSATLPDPALT